MTRKRHPSSTTTPAIRREIQRSKESNRALAARLGLDPKTVAKWKNRRTTEDSRNGPRQPTSTKLTSAEEALIVVYRRRTRFSLDHCFRVLKQAIPGLSRSALHRCFRRHGLSRIPAGNTEKLPLTEHESAHYTFELYQLPDALGGSYLLLAISNLNSFVFAKPVEGLLGDETSEFLKELLKRAPAGVLTVQTNDHAAFTDRRGGSRNAETRSERHPFRLACRRHGIFHAIVKSKNRAPAKVLRGWKGVAMKTPWEIYRDSPTTHYWRKAAAHAHEDDHLALKMAVERGRRAAARKREAQEQEAQEARAWVRRHLSTRR
jgi:hypothetical protein